MSELLLTNELGEIRLKAYKKLLDMSNWKEVVKKATSAESDEEAREELRELINLEIQDHIAQSISSAIPRALYLKMKMTGAESILSEKMHIHIGPFSYGLETRPGGFGLSINPTFNSIDEGGERWKIELFEHKPHKNDDLAHLIAKYIDDDVFINTVLNFLRCWEYDTTNNEWIKNEPRFEGLIFTGEDVKFLCAIHVLTILYTLINGDEDDEGRMELEIPSEGVYTLTPSKDGFLIVNFVPAKEYKLAIKNDSLSDELAEV
jgi:hypothetical protein